MANETNKCAVLTGCLEHEFVSAAENWQCYDDADVCFFTNGTVSSQPAGEDACHRMGLFLPRVTDSVVHSKLAQFRANASHSVTLDSYGFWIDVTAVNSSNTFRWINGSQLAGL